MLHALKSGAVTLAAAALVLTGTTAAHAQKVAYHDEVADVWNQTPSVDTPGGYDYAPAGSAQNTDLVRTTAKHGRRNLILTAEYERLAKRDHLFYSLWEIRADSPTTSHHVYVGAAEGNRAGTPYFYVGAPGVSRAATPRALATPRQGTSCAMTHDINYRRNLVTATIPRSCLGTPEKVKVRSVGFGMSAPVDELLIDNGRTDGHQFTEQRWTRPLAAG